MYQHKPSPHLRNIVPVWGNALQEYGIVGALIVLVCIGMMSQLGLNLNDQIAGLRGDLHTKIQKAKDAESTQALSVQTFTESIPAPTVYSANPSTAQLTNTSNSSGSDSPQTAGSNGTNLYATQLETIAQQGLASGSLTQQQYDILMRLANQGHDIANVERMLEDARQRAKGDTVSYNTFRYNYKGQSYSAPDLANLMTNNATQFNNLRGEAANLGLFSLGQDQGMHIDRASGKILGNSYQAASIGSDATRAVGVGVDETLPGNTGSSQSADTHAQSAIVCTSSNYQDSGTQCGP